MSEVSGVVQKIDQRRVGVKQNLAYDIYVSGQKYGCGFIKPVANEGDYVTFVAEANGNFWNVAKGSLKVGKAPAGEVSKPTTAVRQAVGGFDSRQDAISRQAASNTAIAWVNLLHTAGALPTGSKTKGALQSALDVIRRQYEREFFEGNTGNEWKDISPTPKVDASDEAGDDTPDDEQWQ